MGVVLPAASAPGRLHGLPGKERALRWRSQAWALLGFLQPLSEQLLNLMDTHYWMVLIRPDSHMKQPVLQSSRSVY